MSQSRTSDRCFQIRDLCPYLVDHRESRAEYLMFRQEVNPSLYDALIGKGWRRYGTSIYHMLCPGCSLCIPLRIQADSIRMSGSLKRILALNRELVIIPMRAAFLETHYRLWRDYSIWKHSCDPQELDEASYRELLQPWSMIFEYRQNEKPYKLLALSFVDPLADGLSSVYFSFLPEAKKRSLGFFSMLAEAYIAEYENTWIASTTGHEKSSLPSLLHAEAVLNFYTRKEISSTRPKMREICDDSMHGSCRYYYLGFWVPGASKMDYKARIRPFELAMDDGASSMGKSWRQFACRDEALAYLQGVHWSGI